MIGGAENAALKNARPISDRGGKCGTGKYGTKIAK